MADLNITTDFSQVNDLNNALAKTTNLFNKTVDSLVREEARASRVTKMLAETTEKNLDLITRADAIVAAKLEQESLKRIKTRSNEAARAEKEALRIIATNAKIAASEAKLAAEVASNRLAAAQQSTVNLNQSLGVTGTPATGAGAGFGAIEGEVERLRLKYDQIYASSQLYTRSLTELKSAHILLGWSTKQHEAAVESLNLEYQNFQNGIVQVGNRFSQHVNQTASGMNRMGVVAQQTGYQVSDFIVQVQGGTNPLVAFSQQAAQLAGMLYLMPPAFQAIRPGILGFTISMSAAISVFTIAIPLLSMLAMAFLSSGKEAKAAADGPIKDAEDSIRSLESALKDYLLTKKAGTLGISKDELISTTSMEVAEKALADAEARLIQIDKDAKKRAILGGPESGGFALFTSRAEAEAQAEAIVALQEDRRRAAEVLLQVQQRGNDTYHEQRRTLEETYKLDLARLDLGENSLALKELEAEVDRKSYADNLRSNNELSARQIAALVSVYKSQQDLLAARELELNATENQRSSDAARAQERLAAEKQYRSLVSEAQAKDQYWSNQAKAAERQQIAVQHIMDTLSLLAVREDSEGFNKAMEAALAAGVHFSQVDLSSLVAMAAKNGWSLVDALRAAWAASQGGPVVNANPSMGPNFEGGGRMGSASAPYIPPALTLDDIINMDADKSGGGGGGGGTQSAIEELQKQLAVEKELLGTSEAYQKVHQALGDEFKTTSPEIIAGLVQQATEIEHLIALEEQRKQIIDTVSSSVENALMSMVDGTQSVKDAFRSMASEIIKELYRIYVVQQIVGFVTDAVSGGMGFFSAPSTGTGGLPFGGELAVGGPIDPGAAYLVGEKGPELVVPRSSGTVMTASQTANALSGGGSGAVTVNNNITVTGSDAAMVRAEVSKMIPQITNVTKAAVIDARLRGGQMKQAFR